MQKKKNIKIKIIPTIYSSLEIQCLPYVGFLDALASLVLLIPHQLPNWPIGN